jgi:hypothetical protein
MNESTKEFLTECKKAGYKHITIGIQDKRVPSSMKVEKQGDRKYGKFPSGGDYWNEEKNDDGKIIRHASVVCGEPKIRLDSSPSIPAIWGIVKKLNLTSMLVFGGAGNGETHNINQSHNLEIGYYNLEDN